MLLFPPYAYFDLKVYFFQYQRLRLLYNLPWEKKWLQWLNQETKGHMTEVLIIQK